MILLAMIKEYIQNYTDFLICLGQNQNNLGHRICLHDVKVLFNLLSAFMIQIQLAGYGTENWYPVCNASFLFLSSYTLSSGISC